ncbi:MAG: DUF1992 domain-containing protein [Anaerolineae bacterium]|nr:DUF1992 domain-containing protein [Anaerolineae bacterium]
MSDRDRMKRWESFIDEQVKRAIGDGDMQHLPGAGMPLNLDANDLNVPEDLRIAYKMMKDNDVAPEWIMTGQELYADKERIERRLQAFAKSYKDRLAEADRVASFILMREADERWQTACDRIRKEVNDYNKKVLNFNISVPPQINQRIPLNADVLIRKALDTAQ